MCIVVRMFKLRRDALLANVGPLQADCSPVITQLPASHGCLGCCTAVTSPAEAIQDELLANMGSVGILHLLCACTGCHGIATMAEQVSGVYLI